MNHITKIILVQRKIIKVREEESQVARRAKKGITAGRRSKVSQAPVLSNTSQLSAVQGGILNWDKISRGLY